MDPNKWQSIWELKDPFEEGNHMELSRLCFRDDDQDHSAEKVCRKCRLLPDSRQLIRVCNCVEKSAYIHSHCLKQLIETNGEEKCGICGQNWLGIEIVKKRKGFIDFFRENSEIFKTC